jgi:hypothetical protein
MDPTDKMITTPTDSNQDANLVIILFVEKMRFYNFVGFNIIR